MPNCSTRATTSVLPLGMACTAPSKLLVSTARGHDMPQACSHTSWKAFPKGWHSLREVLRLKELDQPASCRTAPPGPPPLCCHCAWPAPAASTRSLGAGACGCCCCCWLVGTPHILLKRCQLRGLGSGKLHSNASPAEALPSLSFHNGLKPTAPVPHSSMLCTSLLRCVNFQSCWLFCGGLSLR